MTLPEFSLSIFRLKLDSLKWPSKKLLFFISIEKLYYILKFMALLYFVLMLIRSRFPQLTPCHNKTQITIKSKQEFSGLVNYLFSVYFPMLSSKDDICFCRKLGSAHVKFDHLNQQSNLKSTVKLNSLGPVVRKEDSAIHWINYYSQDSAIGCRNAYPLDSAIQLSNNRDLE